MNNLVYIVNALFGVVSLIVYLRQKKNEKIEIGRLKVFVAFLDRVYYQYTVYHSVEEAFQKGIESAEPEILEMVEKMYEILMLEDEWELRIEKKQYSFRFYYRFLVYSYLAMQYGDDKESIYLENIAYLKRQIFIWILNREKLEHYLAGLIWVVLVPIQGLKLIEIWASCNLSELKQYYELGYGIITRYLLLGITMLCYYIVFWMWHTYEVHFYKSTLLSFLSEQNMIQKCYAWWVQHHPQKASKMIEILRKSSSRLTLPEYWILQKSIILITATVSFIVLAPIIRMQMRVGIYVLGVALVISLFLSNMPKWFLKIRIQLMNKQKEDEAYFYYGIARMIALGGNGDVNEILDWMELSGEIFVPAVEVCMEEYLNDCEEAIEQVKIIEPFVPFTKLMEAFGVSEITGLDEALRPLRQEYDNHIEKRRQDNEISTENKGVLGRFVAFIPMVCVIGLYLIVPFVLESLVQLQEYIKQLQIGL